MNYIFKNASVVSVHSGIIVLNVSGKTRTFSDAKLVSAVDGEIVLDLPRPILTEGAYLTVHLIYDDTNKQRTFIVKLDDTDAHRVCYHVSQCRTGIKYAESWLRTSISRYATPEEIQELNDQLATEGKHWNPATMQIEKLRWKPKYSETYFAIIINISGMYVSDYLYRDDPFDEQNCKLGNCFPTRKEAEAKLEQIQKLLLEV